MPLRTASSVARPIACVVLDPELRQADPDRFAALLDGFVAGYLEHFKGDEAEPPVAWRARITGRPAPQPVMRIVVAVDGASGREEVVGGVACEYYRAPACVLVTYLYVVDDPAYRARGHVRRLMAEAQAACRRLGHVRAVLAEGQWPEALRAEALDPESVTVARRRLRFFARLGARLVNIDYVQPGLAVGQRPVSHLRLFVLPEGPDTPPPEDDDLAATIAAFLAEFYAALAQDSHGPVDEATLARLRAQLDARPLTMPVPRLHLPDVAVCFHFVEPLGGSAGEALLTGVRNYQCPVLHSMETDLLSRAYRRRRLFRTVCLTTPPKPAKRSEPADREAGIAVEIEFPSRLVFQTENRREERQWPLRGRRVRAYLAPTFFFDASLIVWHLTLRAGAGAPDGDARDWLDELDVITLLRLADDDADQEFLRIPDPAAPAPLDDPDDPDGFPRGLRAIEGIRFRLAGAEGATLTINELLRAVGGVAQQRDRRAPLPGSASPPRAATVEILDWATSRDQPFFGVADRLEREALCGIITGILDFDEIDDAEARDTLTASVPLADALLRVHREALIYVRKEDRAARTVAGTVGVSPYLILPHAATLCNEWLLEQFEVRPRPGRDASSAAALSNELERLEDTLRTKWVPNPFFYPTERALYESALVEGGTEARRLRLEQHLLELKTRLQLAREAQRAWFEAKVTALLGALSVVSADPLIVDATAWVQRLVPWLAIFDGRSLGHAFTVALALLFYAAILAWKRPTGEDDRRLGR